MSACAAARPWVRGALIATTATSALADAPAPPWVDEGEVPLPAGARSVIAKPGERGRDGDMVLFMAPNRSSGRRGVTAAGTTLPIFGARRGGGCDGKWWLVGPLAWTCSDGATLSMADASSVPRLPGPDGLLHEYFFVRPEGTSAYESIESTQEGAPDRELDGGWGRAVLEQKSAGGQRWGRTSKGLWVAMPDMGAARPTVFHGETLQDGPLDIAWVVTDLRERLPERVAESGSPWTRAPASSSCTWPKRRRGLRARVGDGRWMVARDLARPHLAPPPAEVALEHEKWIDVELPSQTLVAYEGTRPVYATLVSTGRGPQGSDSATPIGVHRIWVKILASDMDNTERDDIDSHYSLEDVPYVQFFDHAVGLHGTYWHRDFGHVRSHGCVNLAPLDARWLFEFTGPRLPEGWVATYPTSFDPGTVVRVRN